MILFDTFVLSRVFRRKHPGVEERRLQVVFTELMTSDVPLGLPGIVLQEGEDERQARFLRRTGEEIELAWISTDR